MEKSNDTGVLLGALLAGVIIGGAIGILLAPDKGSVTRSKLLGGAKDLAEDVKKKVMEEAEALRSQARDPEKVAREAAENTQQQA